MERSTGKPDSIEQLLAICKDPDTISWFMVGRKLDTALELSTKLGLTNIETIYFELNIARRMKEEEGRKMNASCAFISEFAPRIFGQTIWGFLERKVFHINEQLTADRDASLNLDRLVSGLAMKVTDEVGATKTQTIQNAAHGIMSSMFIQGSCDENLADSMNFRKFKLKLRGLEDIDAWANRLEI